MDEGAVAWIIGEAVRNSMAHPVDDQALRIEITLHAPRGGIARLVVADNGHGMPRELAKRAFQEFVSGGGKGTGIGLAVVYRLCVQMGWSPQIESMVGRGTTLTFHIPMAHGGRQEMTHAQEQSAGSLGE
jgi:signal transduction histidine kinase